jgi:PBSX family phage terminase large subunit
MSDFEDIELNMVMLPKQHRFVFSKERYRAFIGGFGSSKSFALADFFAIRMFKLKREVCLLAAPTYPQLTASTMEALFKRWDMLGIKEGIDYTWKRGDKEIRAHHTGSKMFVRSLDDAFKIQGMTLTCAGIDEIEGVTDKVWRTLKTRIRAPLVDPESFHAIRLAGNPPSGDHWFLRDFYNEETRLPGHVYETSSTLENWFLDDETLHELEKNIYKVGTPMWRRYINGELDVAPEGLVYGEFDEKLHCVTLNDVPWDDITNWIYGMDFGYLNATVHLVVLRDRFGRYWLVDEYYMTQDTIENHARRMKQRRIKHGLTYSDHDRQEREQYAKLGIYTLPAFKDLDVGIDAVRNRLNPDQDGGAGFFVVGEKCPNFMRERRNYKYPEEKEGKTIDERPVKVDDHVMDATRYVIASDMKARGLIIRGRVMSTSKRKVDVRQVGKIQPKQRRGKTVAQREREKRKRTAKKKTRHGL